MRIDRRMIAGVIVAGCASAAYVGEATGAIVANFADGNGTTLPDQWTGTPGNGWLSGWNTAGGALGAQPGFDTPGVTTSTPLTGGSATHLQFVDDNTTLVANARRQFGAFGDVSPAAKFRLSFKYRFDGDLSPTVFTDSNRINILGNTTDVGSTATSSTFGIGVIGGGAFYVGHWYFYDNTNPSANGAFTKANMVDTGLSIVGGRTYSFTVDVDPVNYTYAATIDDGINPAFSATDLNFRRAFSSTPLTDAWINFAETATSGASSAAFSVSDLVISNPVPEPTTASLLAIGTAGLLRRRRRI